jgi:Hemerythrin HHE cation binding domain
VVTLIEEANRLINTDVVEHERDDENRVYPRLSKLLHDGNVLAAMSRAHREILHLSRLLDRLSDGLKAEDADRYLIRDAQRVIEAIESLVRIHSAQEEDIYEHAASG